MQLSTANMDLIQRFRISFDTKLVLRIGHWCNRLTALSHKWPNSVISCAVKGSFLFPLHLGDEHKQRSKLKKHHPRLGRRGAHGLRVFFYTYRESLKGSSQVVWMWGEKLPAVGKQYAFFSPNFTQPGKSLLEIPCRPKYWCWIHLNHVTQWYSEWSEGNSKNQRHLVEEHELLIILV